MKNALAEKRARVDNEEEAFLCERGASKVPRRVHDLGESITVRRSAWPTNNPLANRRNQEEGDDLEMIAEMVERAREAENKARQMPQEEMRRQSSTRDTISPENLKEKTKPLNIPIRWMKGQVPFTIADALDGSSSRLSITLPQLLYCSPRLRRDLAELLHSSVPGVRVMWVAIS